MAKVSTLKFWYWSLLAKPVADRALYKLMKRERPTRIVELGIGSVDRTVRLLALAETFAPGVERSYTGLDWFEERRPELPKLSLKAMHKTLHETGAKSRIMPGGPTMALSMLANSLVGTQLLLISQLASEELLAPVWFYLPRMCDARCIVLREEPAGETSTWRRLTTIEIAAAAEATQVRRAA